MPGTNVLPNAWLIDAHLDIGKKHDQIHALARNCGGAVTKKFSQGSDDKQKGVGYWYHQRKKASGARWGGVCKALSVYWIGFHASDRDFWGWLTDNSGWMQAVRANEVADLHGEYGKRGNLSQDAWTRKALAQFGVIEQRGNHNGGLLKTVGKADQKMGSGRSYLAGSIFANAIAPNYKGIGRYKQFSFHRQGGGHAVAAWVAQDVAFFDPNYGEYWFETTAGFRKFFPEFWELTYGAKYTGEWYINSYGQKAF